MKTVKNFCESPGEQNTLVVGSVLDEQGNPRTIILTCYGGSLTMQHGMTPNQARQLASLLQAEANLCEFASKPRIVYLEESGV